MNAVFTVHDMPTIGCPYQSVIPEVPENPPEDEPISQIQDV